MPFKSLKQKRFLIANKPELASKWAKEFGAKVGKSIKYKKPKETKMVQRMSKYV